MNVLQVAAICFLCIGISKLIEFYIKRKWKNGKIKKWNSKRIRQAFRLCSTKTYRATNTKKYSLECAISTEADIIEQLEAQSNKSGYIKSLIRKEIENKKPWNTRIFWKSRMVWMTSNYYFSLQYLLKKISIFFISIQFSSIVLSS